MTNLFYFNIGTFKYIACAFNLQLLVLYIDALHYVNNKVHHINAHDIIHCTSNT